VIVILVTYLVIANVRGERRAAVEPADAAPLVLVALHVPPAESP
jgi:hypothetical protein